MQQTILEQYIDCIQLTNLYLDDNDQVRSLTRSMLTRPELGGISLEQCAYFFAKPLGDDRREHLYKLLQSDKAFEYACLVPYVDQGPVIRLKTQQDVQKLCVSEFVNTFKRSNSVNTVVLTRHQSSRSYYSHHVFSVILDDWKEPYAGEDSLGEHLRRLKVAFDIPYGENFLLVNEMFVKGFSIQLDDEQLPSWAIHELAALGAIICDPGSNEEHWLLDIAAAAKEKAEKEAQGNA